MKKNHICYFFLIVLVFLVAINYHPHFLNINTKDGNNPISPLVVYATLIVAVLSFKPRLFLKNTLFKVYSSLILVVFFFAALFGGLGYNSSGLWVEARTILLPLLFLTIGYSLDLSEKQFVFVCLLYGLVVSFSATSQVMSNFGAFVIEELNYVTSKNRLGALTATASIVSFSMAFTRRMKLLPALSFSALGVFLFVLVLTIRCRTSTVCILFFLLFYIFKLKLFKPKHFVYLFLGLTVFVVIAKYTNILSTAVEYAYSSFTLNHENDLTADRTRRNIEAWAIIQNSPVLGRMTTNVSIDWVHNYLLRVTSDYGLLGAFPLLTLYAILVLVVIRNLRKVEVRDTYSIGHIAMLVPLVTSLAEPTFPFGPGTAVFFSFFLFGVSLSKAKANTQR